MTPEQIESERAAFEADVSQGMDKVEACMLLGRKDGDYCFGEIYGGWVGWKSRAEQAHAERREMQETEQRLRAEIARLQAVASRAVPDGWRLVPVEPTKAMWVAVNKLDDEMAAGGYDGKGCTIEQAWHCLLDAAPQPAAPVQDCPSRAGI